MNNPHTAKERHLAIEVTWGPYLDEQKVSADARGAVDGATDICARYEISAATEKSLIDIDTWAISLRQTEIRSYFEL